MYLPTIRPQINNATPFMSECVRNSEDVHGTKARVPLHLGRNEGIANIGENDDIPTAQFQRYDAAEFFTRINIGTIELTQAVIKSAGGNDTSYLTPLESEQKGVTDNLKENFGRQLVVNDDDSKGSPANINISVGGSSGKLAQCGTTNDDVEVVLASDTPKNFFRYLRKNMLVDIVTATTGVKITDGEQRTITAVDRVNKTVTLDGATGVTTASTDIIVRAGGAAGQNAWGKEMRGIQSVTKDDTALMGIDPADWDEWKAAVLDNGGTARPFSEMLLQELLDEVDANSGEQPDYLLCEYTQERAIYAELKNMKRAVNRTDLKGGHTAMTFNDRIPILVDRQFRPDAIIAGVKKHQAIYETSDWDWVNEDGQTLRWVPRKLKFEGSLAKYADFGVDRRNAFGILRDLDDAV